MFTGGVGKNWLEQYDRALHNAAEQMPLWNDVDVLQYTVVVPVDSWQHLQAFLRECVGDGWFFRGHGESTWRLRPSLERQTAFPIPRLNPETRQVDGTFTLPQDAFYAEHELTREFQRRAHHYLGQLPPFDEHLEWLALMQHHGVPTRLLDWTKSPYVGLFFALNEVGSAGQCCVWAIDAGMLDTQARDLMRLPETPASLRGFREAFVNTPDFQAVFVNDPVVAVLPLQPFRMNERLTVQQGVFLCPANLVLNFENNLAAVLSRAAGSLKLYRLDIPSSLRHEFLTHLNRMNINHATLFPGLDGFAAHLRSNFRLRYEARLKSSAGA